MGSTALGFWRSDLDDGVVKCFSSSSRIRRCIPKGTARPASQRFNVEYVTQRNLSDLSDLARSNPWHPYTLAHFDFNRLWQNDVRRAALRADRAETWDRLLVDLEERV